MTKRILILAMLLLSGTHASAATYERNDPVDAFSSNVEFCAYMVSAPGWESQEFSERFESAVRLAMNALRQADQAMTEHQAIFALKARCDVTNAKPWPDERRTPE